MEGRPFAELSAVGMTNNWKARQRGAMRPGSRDLVCCVDPLTSSVRWFGISACQETSNERVMSSLEIGRILRCHDESSLRSMKVWPASKSRRVQPRWRQTVPAPLRLPYDRIRQYQYPTTSHRPGPHISRIQPVVILHPQRSSYLEPTKRWRHSL